MILTERLDLLAKAGLAERLGKAGFEFVDIEPTNAPPYRKWFFLGIGGSDAVEHEAAHLCLDAIMVEWLDELEEAPVPMYSHYGKRELIGWYPIAGEDHTRATKREALNAAVQSLVEKEKDDGTRRR